MCPAAHAARPAGPARRFGRRTGALSSVTGRSNRHLRCPLVEATRKTWGGLDFL
jgi:hypothetical protein